MDKLDRQIIDVLQDDGRATNAGIARCTGVSEGTVRRRLKRLVDEKYINVVALLDPPKVGYNSEALIGIQVQPDKIDQVAHKLTVLDEMSWVSVTTGAFDIFAWATLDSPEALGNFLRTKVGTILGVQRTETFVNLSVKKRGLGLSTKLWADT